VGVLLYAAGGTEEEKGRYLQDLSTILTTRGPQSGIPAEQTLIDLLKQHAMGLVNTMEQAQTYYSAHRFPETNGHPNGHATNGQVNGNSPNGHPQTNGDSPYIHPEEVRAVVSSYHGATGQAKGEHLQHLLSILTSGRVPNGVEREEQALIDSLRVHAAELKATMRHASEYYVAHGLSLDDISEEAMNNFNGHGHGGGA
jgi:hypothetical protein